MQQNFQDEEQSVCFMFFNKSMLFCFVLPEIYCNAEKRKEILIYKFFVVLPEILLYFS